MISLSALTSLISFVGVLVMLVVGNCMNIFKWEVCWEACSTQFFVGMIEHFDGVQLGGSLAMFWKLLIAVLYWWNMFPTTWCNPDFN